VRLFVYRMCDITIGQIVLLNFNIDIGPVDVHWFSRTRLSVAKSDDQMNDDHDGFGCLFL
jgi:hypothetical protein